MTARAEISIKTLVQRIGERIKKRREYLALKSGVLAKQVGVTVSCLSQIENGKAYPSILTIKKIADQLNTTVGELIGENETLTRHPLVRAEERKFFRKNSGTEIFLLSRHDHNKQMETYLFRFAEKSHTGKLMKKHSGQEFCFVLEGKVQVCLGDEEYALSKGDSIYFNSNRVHSTKNIYGRKSEMLWVVTPPYR